MSKKKNFFRQSGTPLLFDLYPVGLLGISVRKLKNSYSGFCMEVERSSDSATMDVGFDATGNLDTASILSWSGSDTVKVLKWYNQGSLGGHFVLGANYTLINAGTLNTLNGVPAITTTTTAQFTSSGMGDMFSVVDYSIYQTCIFSGSYTMIALRGNSSSGYSSIGVTSATNIIFRNNLTTTNITVSSVAGNHAIYHAYNNSGFPGTIELMINTTDYGSSALNGLFRPSDYLSRTRGTIQELLFFDTYYKSQTEIYDDISAYFSI